MAENGNRDMAAMQRDAERRIREMQKKAETALNGNGHAALPRTATARGNPIHSEISKTAVSGAPNVSTEPSSSKTSHGGIFGRLKGLDILRMFNLKSLSLGGDFPIIIVLILLLSNDETDELLLLALIYIML